jgi:hypothetical protein
MKVGEAVVKKGMEEKDGEALVKKRKKALLEKEEPYAHLVTDLCEEMESFASHAFVGKWQYNQYKELKKNLPEGWVLSVCDFAENYRCNYQDEISSAYYQYEQATVHPIVLFYKCVDCCEQVQEACVFISPDNKHDHQAVAWFQEQVRTHLTAKNVPMLHHVQFSDGCPSQYKSIGPFYTCATSKNSEERAFFGSRHGKGPCDSVGGTVKSLATSHVIRREGIIRNAHEMFMYCEKDLTINRAHGEPGCHSLRTFFFVDKVDRPTMAKKMETLQGTQKVHSVKNDTDTPKNVALYRSLSCFCTLCNMHTGPCENMNYVKPWSTFVPTEKKPAKRGKIGCQEDVSVLKKSKKSAKVKFKEMKDVEESKVQGKKKSAKVKPKEMNDKERLVGEAKVQEKKKAAKVQTKPLEEERAPVRQNTSRACSASKKRKAETRPVDASKKRKVETPSLDEGRVPVTRASRRCASKSPKSPKVQSPKSSFFKSFDMHRTVPKVEKMGQSRKQVYALDTSRKSATQQKTQTSAQLPTKYKGPVPQRDVKKLFQALIHSPREIQISTINNVFLSEIDIRTDLSIVGLKATVDASALPQVPEDIPDLPKLAMPIIVDGDGNCLARCGSILAYGAECYHLDIRLRIAIEMIIHQDQYLDADFLSKGLPTGHRLTPAQVAHFSGNYTGNVLTEEEVQVVYRNELHQVMKPNEFMGLWQIFALASVLKHPIFSVYPEKGNRSVRQDLHRLILPRETIKSTPLPVFVMWTSAREDMTEEYWTPNHFVVILPTVYSHRALNTR